MKHRQILKFIKTVRESIIGAEFIYKNGSCYQFYLILKSIIPEAKAYYNVDHCITKIGDRYYDIGGEVECTNHHSVDEYYDHKTLKPLKFKIHIFDHQTIKKMKAIEHRELASSNSEHLLNIPCVMPTVCDICRPSLALHIKPGECIICSRKVKHTEA